MALVATVEPEGPLFFPALIPLGLQANQRWLLRHLTHGCHCSEGDERGTLRLLAVI